VSIAAWVASPADISAAAETGVLTEVRAGRAHEHILASTAVGAQAHGSCVLLTDRSIPWLDGFTAPPGDEWRGYITALTAVALRRASELNYEFVETDIYEFGDATREPLQALGFGPAPGPPHYEHNRIWRAATTAPASS
jgi:hypothetical protein